MTPFLPAPLTAAQTTRVAAWLPVLEVLLTKRYGDRITTEPSGTDPVVAPNEPAFVSAAADAIGRRLAKPAALIDQQNIGPAGVRYNARNALAVWFLPEELAQLDDLVADGGGGARTYRTPAPDGIRRLNRARDLGLDHVAESDGYVEEWA